MFEIVSEPGPYFGDTIVWYRKSRMIDSSIWLFSNGGISVDLMTALFVFERRAIRYLGGMR